MGKEKTDGKRMITLLQSGKLANRGGQCIDLYNQEVWQDMFVTITTRVDQCNHYWVTVYEEENKSIRPRKDKEQER